MRAIAVLLLLLSAASGSPIPRDRIPPFRSGVDASKSTPIAGRYWKSDRTRQTRVVKVTMEFLRMESGEPEVATLLLCDDPDCPHCSFAVYRKDRP